MKAPASPAARLSLPDSRSLSRVWECALPGLPTEYHAQRLTGQLVGGYYSTLGCFATFAEAAARLEGECRYVLAVEAITDRLTLAHCAIAEAVCPSLRRLRWRAKGCARLLREWR